MSAQAAALFEHPARARRSRDVKHRAADVAIDVLAQAGVSTLFGMPGGAVAQLYDALLDRPDINVVTMRHDGNSVFAAAGYAQTTGQLGVAIVTSGPGILNCMNAIACANADGLPVLVICGESPRRRFGRGAVQEGSSYALNVVGMASSITKLAFEVPDGNAVASMLRRAISTALSGRRGAVLVSLPLDVLGQKVLAPSGFVDVDVGFHLDDDSVARAARALNANDRKLIFVGSGARYGETPALIRKIAERIQAPVMTTPKAKGIFPENHPLSVGVFGMGGHPSSKALVREGLDTILVLGSSLNEIATDGWNPNLAAERCFIHVDIDSTRIGRVYPTDVPIVAHADTFLRRLLPRLRQSETLRRFGVIDAESESADGRVSNMVSPVQVLREVQQVVPENTIYTMDSGNNLFFALHYLRVHEPDSFVALFGLASMGVSLPAAIGVQLAQPHRTVVAVMGDGGFLMSAGELSVAARSELPLVVLVLNDFRLNMVEHGDEKQFKRKRSFSTAPLDLPSVARGLGAECVVIERAGQLANLDLTQRRNRPIVIDARICPRVTLPPNGRFDMLIEGRQSALSAAHSN